MLDVDFILARKSFILEIHEQFPKGITGIFGPSGSGKSSLLQTIAGLETPEKGHITIDKEVLYDSNNRLNVAVNKRQIGYVFQEGRLFPHMTVEQNLKYGYSHSHQNGVSLQAVVDLLELNDLLDQKPLHISGGERQRVALGRSLLSSPRILLLDEPFSAVDVNLRNQIIPFITRIVEHLTIPILVVSHDLPDLLKLTNRLFLLKDGKCLGHGDYYDLLKLDSFTGMISSSVLINAIEVVIKDVSKESGMVLLSHENNDENMIKCALRPSLNAVGKAVKVFIHADHIALSVKPLE
ncbi:MAG: ATP-binding cassette domain-containing protein, partial [Bacteroidia bacterium]|nr:ATP-binding cassette domain-containing protein [Bacteroidia bacterium]